MDAETRQRPCTAHESLSALQLVVEDLQAVSMERDEFEQLVMSYLDEVNAFAHYLTDTDWEAEELVQATYRNAFERWETLAGGSKCRSWLFRIARNLWTDWMRSRRTGPDLELVDPQDEERPRASVGPEKVEQLDEKQVREALRELPRKQSEVVVLCDIWGFAYREIAEIVDVPVGTVRSRISRGRSKLVDVIEGYEEDVEGGEQTGSET